MEIALGGLGRGSERVGNTLGQSVGEYFGGVGGYAEHLVVEWPGVLGLVYAYAYASASADKTASGAAWVCEEGKVVSARQS